MNFFKCGAIGLFFEIFWTGITNFSTHDKKLRGTTSLLMFPIYGMAFLIKPVYRLIHNLNFFIRGVFYTICIYTTEFFSGAFLKRHNCCPWDYSHAKSNIKGLIRLDYAPLWFIVGLIYEKILMKKSP